MLRVLSVNLFFGQADAEVIVALVRQADPDVLFVQELTADAVTRLKQAGLDDLMPHAQHELRDGGLGRLWHLLQVPAAARARRCRRRSWRSRPRCLSCRTGSRWS